MDNSRAVVDGLRILVCIKISVLYSGTIFCMQDKYKVYNLCSERLYDASLFEGKVCYFNVY